jgi:hypothetical protein
MGSCVEINVLNVEKIEFPIFRLTATSGEVFWNFGILEFWNFEILELWNSRISQFWNVLFYSNSIAFRVSLDNKY